MHTTPAHISHFRWPQKALCDMFCCCLYSSECVPKRPYPHGPASPTLPMRQCDDVGRRGQGERLERASGKAGEGKEEGWRGQGGRPERERKKAGKGKEEGGEVKEGGWRGQGGRLERARDWRQEAARGSAGMKHPLVTGSPGRMQPWASCLSALLAAAKMAGEPFKTARQLPFFY